MEKNKKTFKKLLVLRDKIDQVDTKILSLLNERLKLVKMVGEIKKDTRFPIKDNLREEAKIKSLIHQGKKLGIPDSIIIKFWNTLFKISYKIEKN